MEITPEIMAKVEADRKDRAARIAKIWREGLSHKDWLIDGRPIRGPVMLAYFQNLDWDGAWMDLGPSVGGNAGPYWHVPLRRTEVNGHVYACGDTVHRLYPKVLKTKWARLLLHACYEAQRKSALTAA
jgi:hypothetical protein